MPKNYNPKIYHRQSIRLKDYDYTSDGAYFITICVQNSEYMFGNIIDEKMILNPAGEMIKKWLHKLEDKFKNVELDEFIIMLNHIHVIIFINNIIGADLCVCPKIRGVCHKIKHSEYTGSDLGEHTGSDLGEHTGSPLLVGISQIIRWFKTMTTNEYIRNVKQNNWKPFDKKLWQRNYYDHIIRNEKSLDNIREYIRNNPLKLVLSEAEGWKLDSNNPKNLFM